MNDKILLWKIIVCLISNVNDEILLMMNECIEENVMWELLYKICVFWKMVEGRFVFVYLVEEFILEYENKNIV